MRLFQVKMEQEQHQTEIRDLQDQLSEMHDELDNAKHTDEGEKEVLIEVSYKVPEEGWKNQKNCIKSGNQDTGRRIMCLSFSHSISLKQDTITRGPKKAYYNNYIDTEKEYKV